MDKEIREIQSIIDDVEESTLTKLNDLLNRLIDLADKSATALAYAQSTHDDEKRERIISHVRGVLEEVSRIERMSF